MKQFKKQSTFKSVCAFILAFMLIITNITGLIEVKAAGVERPTINKVFLEQQQSLEETYTERRLVEKL